MKTIEIIKSGKNWCVSTRINEKTDEFFSFKSKKSAEEFLLKYLELGYIVK